MLSTRTLLPYLRPPRSWARLLPAAVALALGACAGGQRPDPTPAPGGQEGTAAGTIEAENLEEDLPVQVEDAFPIGFSDQEVQGLVRYADFDEVEGGDVVFTALRLEAGLASKLQVSLVLPYRVTGEVGTAAVTLGTFYNFLTETANLPAMAVKGEVGIERFQLEAIASRSLDGPDAARKLHLNLAWAHEFDAGPDQRSDRYAAVIGYSEHVGTDNLLFIADLVREQALIEGVEINLAEVGARWQLSRFWILAAGVGIGFGDESPAFRAGIGFQHGFALFP